MTRIINVFIFLISVNFAFSCSCAELARLNKQSVSKLSGAYEGKIVAIEVEDSTWNATYYLLISKVFRGEKIDTLKFTSSDSGMCGIYSRLGDTWIITFPDQKREILEVSICSRIYNLSELKRNKKYYRFRFGNGLHKMMRKIVRGTYSDRRMLKRYGSDD